MDNQNVMENEAMFGEDTALPAYDESYDSDGSGVDVGSALIGAGIAAAIGGVTYVTKKFVAPKVKTKLEEHKAKRAEKKAAKEAKKAEKAQKQEEAPAEEKPVEKTTKKK